MRIVVLVVDVDDDGGTSNKYTTYIVWKKKHGCKECKVENAEKNRSLVAKIP